MAIKTYSLKADGDRRLTENFRVREFACHDGSDRILIDDRLPQLLQEIRDYFGKPVTINSAYRNAAYNKQIGGASASQHVQGRAADIRVQDVPPYAVAAYMEHRIKTGGKYACGYYPISLFCHVDTRPAATLFLEYKRSKTSGVSTFGFGSKYELYQAKEEEEVTQEDFNRMMDAYLKERATEGASTWSAADRQWAEDNGVVQGTGAGMSYKSFLTKEEAVALVHRAISL